MSKQNEYQNENTISVWDNIGYQYEREKYWQGLENQANLQMLLSHIGEPSEKKIIEFGCGSGFTSIALAERGAKVALVDISPISLEKAVAAFSDAGLPAPEHYLADALDCKLPSNQYDVVWNGGVIEHFFDEGKKKMILEMLRVAKNGGKVIILVPNAWCWQFQLAQAWLKRRKAWPYGFEDDMSPSRLEGLCRQIGLNNFTTYAFNTILGWRWLPRFGQLVKIMGLDTLENHCRRSRMGFVSVLVIEKT